MRILEINDVAFTAGLFTRGLSSLGYEAELYQPTIGTYRQSRAIRASLPLIRTVEGVRLGRYVRERHFDLLHIHYATFGVMGELARAPYCLHCHGGDLRRDLRLPVRGRVVRACLARAKKVFYSTPDLGEYVRAIRPDAVYLHNPVDVETFRPDSHPPARTSGPPEVLSISKMDTTKGWRILEPLLIELTRRGYRVRAFGFGNEPKATIQRRVGVLREAGVQIMNRLPHEAMIDQIRRADVIVGQMASGAAGISEFESLACGKTVLCHFVWDSAYPVPSPFVKADSVQSAAAWVDKAIEHPEWNRRQGEAGRRWVVEHHGVEATARGLARELEPLVS